MLGRDLEALIQRAREFKKEYGDSFMSVEHLVLGFIQDQRFGKQLFRDFQISQQTLKSAIEAIRGRQSVIDQGYIIFFLSFFLPFSFIYLFFNYLLNIAHLVTFHVTKCTLFLFLFFPSLLWQVFWEFKRAFF